MRNEIVLFVCDMQELATGKEELEEELKLEKLSNKHELQKLENEATEQKKSLQIQLEEEKQKASALQMVALDSNTCILLYLLLCTHTGSCV